MPPRLRMTAQGGAGVLHSQRCFEIRTGLGDDLFTQFSAQFRHLNFLDRTARKVIQIERPERDADQPVHLQAEIFQNLSHLAILALTNAKSKPDVGALFTVERRFDRAVADAIDGDAIAKPVEPLLAHTTECPYPIAA